MLKTAVVSEREGKEEEREREVKDEAKGRRTGNEVEGESSLPSLPLQLDPSLPRKRVWQKRMGEIVRKGTDSKGTRKKGRERGGAQVKGRGKRR